MSIVSNVLASLGKLPSTVKFCSAVEPGSSFEECYVIGRLLALLSEPVIAALPPWIDRPMYRATVQALSPKDYDAATSSVPFLVEGRICTLHICAVTSMASRHNAPSRTDQVFRYVRKNIKRPLGGSPKDRSLVILVCGGPDVPEAAPECVQANVGAVAKGLNLFSAKSGKRCELTDSSVVGETAKQLPVLVLWSGKDGLLTLPERSLPFYQHMAQAIQLTGALVDIPPFYVNPSSFTALVESLAASVGFDCKAFCGDELLTEGLRAIHAVGRASSFPPAMVVCSLKANQPSSPPSRSVVFVGKGITYDTGGLSIKTKEGMCKMKNDMAGAAACFGAFLTLALSAKESAAANLPNVDLHCILCLAENAVGPNAFRNDDIIEMYSGKTVEINNTDAEGRLVLSDGVAYACATLNPSLIVDMATLTGAQSSATGKAVAAILANNERSEMRGVISGKKSGELVYPVIYTPELLLKEFDSSVADMKNSVGGRSNALCSCAGLFISRHLSSNFIGDWLHVDMAGPAFEDERATAWGVGFLLTLVEEYKKECVASSSS